MLDRQLHAKTVLSQPRAGVRRAWQDWHIYSSKSIPCVHIRHGRVLIWPCQDDVLSLPGARRVGPTWPPRTDDGLWSLYTVTHSERTNTHKERGWGQDGYFRKVQVRRNNNDTPQSKSLGLDSVRRPFVAACTLSKQPGDHSPEHPDGSLSFALGSGLHESDKMIDEGDLEKTKQAFGLESQRTGNYRDGMSWQRREALKGVGRTL